jgi:VanZ family protein
MKFMRFKWTFIWTLTILVLCFLPSNKFPESDWFTLLKFDKVVHLGIYFILYLLVKYEMELIRPAISHRELIVWFYCLFWAGISELIQEFFIPTRFGDIFDFIANSLGIVLGYAAWKYWTRYKLRAVKNEGTV